MAFVVHPRRGERPQALSKFEAQRPGGPRGHDGWSTTDQQLYD